MKTVRAGGTVDQVPNKPKTQHRSVRVEDADWDDLGTVTKAVGTDRAKALNQFIEWYLRRPGAKMPERPSREVIDVATRKEPAGE